MFCYIIPFPPLQSNIKQDNKENRKQGFPEKHIKGKLHIAMSLCQEGVRGGGRNPNAQLTMNYANELLGENTQHMMFTGGGDCNFSK